MRREKTGIERKERKEGAECATRRKRQLTTCGMDVAKSERGRERINWMKEIWKRRDRMEKDRGGGLKEKHFFFWNCYLT
jgi:hypothetical protein